MKLSTFLILIATITAVGYSIELGSKYEEINITVYVDMVER